MRDLASIEATETKHGGRDSANEGRICQSLPIARSEVGSDEIDEQDGNHQRGGSAQGHPSCGPNFLHKRSAHWRSICSGDGSVDKSIRENEVELVQLSLQ
jgi:hypothetical protein